MRRRRGGPAAPAEACGVWLDTAELKRRPAPPLTAKLKAATRILERKPTSVVLTQSRAPQTRTKQTTIPTFFSSHTDEKDKENTRPSPFTSNKDSEDTGVPLAACPVKILALPQVKTARDQPFGSEEGVQVTSQGRAGKAPLPDSLELQVESQSQGKASCGPGGDSWCCSFTQDSEGPRIISHRNKSQLFAGETVSGSSSVTSDWGVTKQEGQEVKAGLDFQPGLGAKQSKKPQQWSSVNSLIDFAETENINPVPGARPWAPGGVCSSPQSPARAQPLRERGQNMAGAGVGWDSPCRELFCQDSEGNRVIAHGCRDRGISQGNSSSCAASSQPRGQQLELGPELLFTQDSEGNRVIKHW
ncbi:PREDICTED: aurora kinase A and ninein-interacting protein-like isoform X1 [Lepidothrix coronata]|uniref:Aurora kinase A and ninein-interacting protein-like isoform X1 n=1 Tax=Lepidothrix coronata TaxID=321398 RepID=A0A6J0III6_9PASS|nr:PREDICTED: aurora kinase A and ninein-interacting protein-like isoform X1 [Lepidothrix coronata]